MTSTPKQTSPQKKRTDNACTLCHNQRRRCIPWSDAPGAPCSRCHKKGVKCVSRRKLYSYYTPTNRSQDSQYTRDAATPCPVQTRSPGARRVDAYHRCIHYLQKAQAIIEHMVDENTNTEDELDAMEDSDDIDKSPLAEPGVARDDSAAGAAHDSHAAAGAATFGEHDGSGTPLLDNTLALIDDWALFNLATSTPVLPVASRQEVPAPATAPAPAAAPELALDDWQLLWGFGGGLDAMGGGLDAQWDWL